MIRKQCVSTKYEGRIKFSISITESTFNIGFQYNLRALSSSQAKKSYNCYKPRGEHDYDLNGYLDGYVHWYTVNAVNYIYVS